METIARIAAFLASGTWLSTHSPAQWGSAFMGLIDSAAAVATSIQSADFESVATAVVFRILSFFF